MKEYDSVTGAEVVFDSPLDGMSALVAEIDGDGDATLGSGGGGGDARRGRGTNTERWELWERKVRFGLVVHGGGDV